MADQRLFHLSHDVTPCIYGAMTLYTKCVHYPLNVNNNDKRTRTVLQITSAQRDKPRLLDKPDTERQWQSIVLAQLIGRNGILRYADSSPMNKKALTLLLALLKDNSPLFGLRLTYTLSSNVCQKV